MQWNRRDLLRLGGVGGGIGLASSIAGAEVKTLYTGGQLPVAEVGGLDCVAGGGSPGAKIAYEAAYQPASYVAQNALDALHQPPPYAPIAAGRVREVQLDVIETTLEVAAGRNMRIWGYGGTAPGTILRATVGEKLRIALSNRTSGKHTLHFHGSHDVSQDGLQLLAPGAAQIIEIEAGPVGLHPYHCHAAPYAWHIAKGMYGAFIVDPPGGRQPAHEYVLCLGGWDLDGDGRNEVYAWNGIAGFYQRYPLKVPVGELVRLYLINMVEYEPVASFHLHAQTFDVFRSGTWLKPHEHTDVVTLGQTERAILEFRLPRRGRYMFHPHQSHMTEKGAMGWITAV
jgi:FtsP/CotA-like multicopper oxidase with cupredoxin domain